MLITALLTGKPRLFLFQVLGLACLFLSPVIAQESAPRGSIVEDRAAAKLLAAGDARLEAEETEKALEIWRSVIERYPRSKVRYEAHLRLGGYLLEKKRVFEEARGHFEAVSAETNPDQEQRAEGTLKTGICFYEGRHYGPSFKSLRKVIEEFPEAGQVNDAWYYIGLGHFKLGHYSRAIEALEKVGTALGEDDLQIQKVEAGKRLHLKVDDADLAILEPGETVTVVAQAKSGDREEVEAHPLGRKVRVVMGSIPTALGKPIPGNGILEVSGGDRISVNYLDLHTADRKFDQTRLFEVGVVGTAGVRITDGGYQDELDGVVLGKPTHLEVRDADFDKSHGADSLEAIAEIWRAKSQEEIDAEIAAAAAKAPPEGVPADEEKEELKIEKYRKIDEVRVRLTEATPTKPRTVSIATSTDGPNVDAALEGTDTNKGEDLVGEIGAEKADRGIHSGLFRGTVTLEEAAAPKGGDQILQAMTGDLVKLRHLDEINLTRAPRVVVTQASCVEGLLGNVRVTKTEIDDSELRVQTQLKTADALVNIGNHYREFGLQTKADLKYDEALDTANEVMAEARKLGGAILEQTYVQLWRTYFAKGDYNKAVGMSQRLMKDFPESTFADEAMLQQAQAFGKKGEHPQAIQLFSSVLKLPNSPLKGEAQFGIAETYEAMAKAAPANGAESLYDRSFVEYQKVYEQHPDSGRVGDAVAKMANFYYQRKDYARAIDVFENVLSEYPDANFLDVILFNYGRCLYRLERRPQARRMFDQLINEFPESTLAPEAKRISEALAKASAPAATPAP